ncbi:MAG: DUF4389 domain-containing protein [Acidimicrobiales bacterium]
MPRLSEEELGQEARVLMGLSMDPPRQSRWTVLFRGILAIPLLFLVFVFTVAAEFVTIVAWFAALFSGRVPDSFQEFLSGWLRLYANVLSYTYLLIPRWPGVAFSSKPRNQVTLEIDHVKLRRAAVFFRIILAIPANLVGELLLLGCSPILLVMWAWGIVAGKEPRPLHQAVALALRFQIRLQAYIALVTPTQPFGGLFGDGVATAASASNGPSTPPVTPTSLTFGASSAPGVATTPTPSNEVNSSPATPTRWFVAKAAKRVVVLVLILGIPVYVVSFVADRPLIAKIQDVVSRTITASSYSTTVNAIDSFQNSVAACSGSTYVGCAAKAATTANDQLSVASAPLANTSLFPPDARSDASTFETYLRSLEGELTVIQTSNSASTSMSAVNEITRTFDKFRSSYKHLKAKLNS